MKIRSKSLLAVLSAAVMLFLAATPASAVSSENFDITDGELQTAVGNFELDGSGTPPPCGATTSTLSADISNGPPWTTAVTATTITTSITLGTPADDYLVTISRDAAGNNAGTIASPSLAVDQNLRVLVSVRADCGAGAEVCRVRVTFLNATDLAGVASVAPSSTGNLTAGDTLTLSGTSSAVTNVLGGPGCNAPFSALTGSTVTIPAADPLVLTVL